MSLGGMGAFELKQRFKIIINGELERGWKAAVKNAVRRMRKVVRKWRMKHFPEDTGALVDAFYLDINTTDLEILTGIDRDMLDSDFYYPAVVNKWNPPINWSKKGTWYHFWDVYVQKFPGVFEQILKEELRKKLKEMNIDVEIKEAWI